MIPPKINVNKIIQELSNAQRKSTEFPDSFLNDEIQFMDAWVSQVKKGFEVPTKSPKEPCYGIVLRSQQIAKPSPGSAADTTSKIGQTTPDPSCQKIWVHTPFDDMLSLPQNFINPSLSDYQIIMMHYHYEIAKGVTLPSAGDIVRVMHPWAQGFANKVGSYIGPVGEGSKIINFSFEKAREVFHKAKLTERGCGKRKKTIPQHDSGDRPGGRQIPQ
tara:strand:- start:8216 stop:8866 length:651 start_codon:yes stop_codon:yes gene_type:complete